MLCYFYRSSMSCRDISAYIEIDCTSPFWYEKAWVTAVTEISPGVRFPIRAMSPTWSNVEQMSPQPQLSCDEVFLAWVHSLEFLDGSPSFGCDPRPSVTVSGVRRLLNATHVAGLRVWANCFGCQMDAGMNCEGTCLASVWTFQVQAQFNLHAVNLMPCEASYFTLHNSAARFTNWTTILNNGLWSLSENIDLKIAIFISSIQYQFLKSCDFYLFIF